MQLKCGMNARLVRRLKDKVSKLKKEMASFKKSEKAKDKELSSFANALKKPRDKL